MTHRTSAWLGARSGSHTSKKSRAAYCSLRTPRGGRRTVPMRRPSPRSRGVPSCTIRTAISWSLPELSDCGDLSRNGRRRARVLRGARPPQLPAVLPRTGRFAHRHLDAEHRARVAGPRADEFALLRRPSRRTRLARRAAALALRRRRGRPHQQTPPRHPDAVAVHAPGVRARAARVEPYGSTCHTATVRLRNRAARVEPYGCGVARGRPRRLP